MKKTLHSNYFTGNRYNPIYSENRRKEIKKAFETKIRSSVIKRDRDMFVKMPLPLIMLLKKIINV